jgi:hypothetical protein
MLLLGNMCFVSMLASEAVPFCTLVMAACVRRYRFALEEALVMLVNLYSKYTFRLSDYHHPGGDLHIRVRLTMAPEKGINVLAVPRVQ